ncbi:PREDICTED: pentatricopeptide repeat-containing protein At1g77360, mitochondrial-like [Tarenaya hassleriana]|uniref:pentatricopeptide repeat-containing protein At1g77360, mitochondrial-like n=1 Tax=Tarenaya hassleriana TaxID=28532 RepID=UPI00053C137C|nr:PREDICTED: pentatricopeptide repeat-containing protein At1g77360, mitochondrial-like [Tarenaya hassleriana]
MMIRILSHQSRSCCKNVLSVKLYTSGEPKRDVSDMAKSICKVMMSSPPAVLDTALDQIGLRVSPEVVETVLQRFRNAGLLAYRFFQWAEKQRSYEHSVRSYHMMIESTAKIRQYKIMWDLVNSMRKKMMLNVETFCIIMRKYARAQKLDEAIYAFNVMEKYDVPPNLVAFNGLLSALCKSKNVRKAQEIFDKMRDRFTPDSKTYSILIEGWGKAPNLPKAREVFREMIDTGCDPDIVTYSIMVDVLCKAGRVDEALGIVRGMDRSKCEPNSFIYSVLVHTYGTEHRLEDAVDTFLEMERSGIKADVPMYNALIGAFCKANRMKNVYRVMNEMERKGVSPNSKTCNIILSHLMGIGDTEEVKGVFQKMIKLCEPDTDTYTMMIKMFCEQKEMGMASKVWKYMRTKGVFPSMHTFSVLINGFCEEGNTRKACVLLEEMIEMGIRPSGGTFGRIRQLLIKEGREDVLNFLNEKMNLLLKEPLCD